MLQSVKTFKSYVMQKNQFDFVTSAKISQRSSMIKTMSPRGEKPSSYPLFETDCSDALAPPPPSADKREWKIVWHNVIGLIMLHLGAVYGTYLIVTKAMWATKVFALFLYLCSCLGVTAGAHRLWAHRAYKARLPLQLLLIFFQTMSFQESVQCWVRNHRMHHKFSETDADPHNPTRGFFFAHIGWILVRKHPDVRAKSHAIDMSDFRNDPVVQFQHKYYFVLFPLVCFILPTYIPTLWGESAWNAFFVCGVLRYISCLNAILLINSAAHRWGTKPYDKNIKPTNLKPLSLFVLGEGFHNYHHTFPWDYKTDELGQITWNLGTLFIDTMAKIGWAYDLKTTSSDMIERRIKRTGDGSHEKWGGQQVHDTKLLSSS